MYGLTKGLYSCWLAPCSCSSGLSAGISFSCLIILSPNILIISIHKSLNHLNYSAYISKCYLESTLFYIAIIIIPNADDFTFAYITIHAFDGIFGFTSIR